MRIKRLSGALVISVVCHLIIVVIAGLHLMGPNYHVDELEEPPKPKVWVCTLGTIKPPKPKGQVGNLILKPGIKPDVPARHGFLRLDPVPPKLATPSVTTIVDALAFSPAADLSNTRVSTPESTAVPHLSNIRIDVPPGAAMLEGIMSKRSPKLVTLAKVGAARDQLETSDRGVLQPHALNPPNGAAYHDVFFKDSGTNPFIDTEDDKFSTFGMDVDTASYSVMRRYLRDGHLPPSEAIRVEEFVNAFDYNYTPPADEAFAIHLEGAPSKFGEGKRLQLLRVGIQGRVVPDNARKDAILTFVIDVSGSMNMENRLGLVKQALTLLLEQLRPGDEVGIVVYGSHARVVLPHTGIENREYIVAAINSLAPDGVTNAEEGLRLGYKLALKNSKSGCINRVILCSDGVANVGHTGPDAILKEIGTYVKEGFMLTTVGFGMGNYNDVLMEQLANKGNGSYAYVDTLSEAKRIFVENLTGTLQVIAKDAKIQVEFNPETVSRFRLLGYENRRFAHEDFRNDAVDAGEVGAGHSVTALYEIKLHENSVGQLATVSIRHENPDTRHVTEVNESLSTDVLKGTFEEATPAFQLAASVAEFAEILRGSFWAQKGSLEDVRETLDGILPNVDAKTREHSVRNAELLSLVREALRFKEQEKG